MTDFGLSAFHNNGSSSSSTGKRVMGVHNSRLTCKLSENQQHKIYCHYRTLCTRGVQSSRSGKTAAASPGQLNVCDIARPAGRILIRLPERKNTTSTGASGLFKVTVEDKKPAGDKKAAAKKPEEIDYHRREEKPLVVEKANAVAANTVAAGNKQKAKLTKTVENKPKKAAAPAKKAAPKITTTKK
ncbi:uncharacterized protein LOC131680816 [Topomyia yanbarensis]|uniref:uncharacterized protein LOC131680816 n=1 Tax=Topomyia yanbarensis TaxID=2498891 RepID=UPI00273B9FDA|nr:uncharacterized protein LOC131680816 [Topomyia yanbarensis]